MWKEGNDNECEDYRAIISCRIRQHRSWWILILFLIQSFTRKYTKFRSFDKFLNGGRFRIASQQDFEALPEAVMDAHVRAVTEIFIM